MKTTIHVGRVLASDAGRRIVGMLLPHGEVGLTSVGPLRVPVEAALEWADRLPVNREHDAGAEVGQITARTATPVGTMVSLEAAATPAGDAALADVRAGRLAGLSVEMDATVTPGTDGVLTALKGRVHGAALVERPAYASALVAAAWEAGQVIEHDGERYRVGQVHSDEGSVELILTRETDPEPAETADTKTDTDEDEQAVTAAQKGPRMTLTTARVPAGIPGHKTAVTAALTYDGYLDKLREAHLSQDVTLTAALKEISQGATAFTTPPQWLGELWGAVDYERVWVDAFDSGELSNVKFKGWQWKTKPKVGRYDGHPKEVPTGGVEGEEVEGTAVRFAGAHNLDRAIYDFGNREFIDAYNREMARSYAEQSDQYIAETMLAGANRTSVTPKGGYPAAIAGVVRGFFDVYKRTNQAPTFAHVAFDLWEEMFETTAFDAPAILKYLAGLTGGQIDDNFAIRPAPHLTDSTVFVGHRSAAKVRELPGTPIRAEAPHIATAGVDTGVYGYCGTLIESAAHLTLVTVGGTAPEPEPVA